MTDMLEFTCQYCGESGVNRANLKKVEYRGAVQFAFVACNGCAEKKLGAGSD